MTELQSERDRAEGPELVLYSSSSDNLREKSGSKEKSKKEATEHDEAYIVVVKASTSSAESPGLHTSTESGGTVESQSHSSTTHTSGQSNDCVRTVAETSPMPDLFAQDDDGDT